MKVNNNSDTNLETEYKVEPWDSETKNKKNLFYIVYL